MFRTTLVAALALGVSGSAHANTMTCKIGGKTLTMRSVNQDVTECNAHGCKEREDIGHVQIGEGIALLLRKDNKIEKYAITSEVHKKLDSEGHLVEESGRAGVYGDALPMDMFAGRCVFKVNIE